MAFKDVDDYIGKAPEETRAMAQELREIILKAAPKSEEKISYNMPYYGYHGRLIYFGAYKHHLGLYIMSDARHALEEEMKPYKTSLATLHFPTGKPLPAALIKKIVQIQAKANESRS